MRLPWSLAGARQTLPKDEVRAGLRVSCQVQMLSAPAALPSPMLHSAERMDTAPDMYILPHKVMVSRAGVAPELPAQLS